jgi:stage III sporulation protein AH
MLAAKLNNGGLNDPTDLSQVLSTDQSKTEQDTQALSQQNYFYDARSERDQQDSTTIQTLNSIISDANTSKEQKDQATKELTQKTMTKDSEDALCMLQSDKATVIVKSPNELQESETVAIQEIVQEISKIKDVIIQVQK